MIVSVHRGKIIPFNREPQGMVFEVLLPKERK